MTFGNRNWITTALLATTTWLGMASTGDATLFGCLRNRQTAYRVPTTCGTCGATPTTTYSIPVPNYSIPVTAYYPQPTNGCGCQTAAPVASTTAARPIFAGWSAPQTNYRTVWGQVPVTYYRPVAGAIPAATSLQPCTGYTYEARRVPYYAHATAAAPVTAYLPTTTAFSGVAPIATGWTTSSSSVAYAYPSSAAPVTTVNSWPGYASAQVFSPSCSATVPQVPQTRCSATAPQSSCASCGSVVPGGPASNVTYEAPATGYTVPGSQPLGAPLGGGSQLQQVPADTRPQLEPTPQAESAKPSYRPPSSYGGVPSPSDAGEGETSYQPPLLDRDFGSPPRTYAPPQGSGFRGANNVRPAPVQPAKSQPLIRPIPDPDRRLRPWSEDQAPSLLDAEERTALRQNTKWDAVPILWQKEEGDHAPRVKPAVDSSEIDSRWDDSGWLPSSR